MTSYRGGTGPPDETGCFPIIFWLIIAFVVLICLGNDTNEWEWVSNNYNNSDTWKSGASHTLKLVVIVYMCIFMFWVLTVITRGIGEDMDFCFWDYLVLLVGFALIVIVGLVGGLPR